MSIKVRELQHDVVRHIAAFCSSIWQIHPFCEGNTRTTAVFVIKYLKTLGFKVDNSLFAENSWYFRNALVRSNFNDLQKDVHATNEFLDAFFENLLMGAGHELKNRFMHVDYEAPGNDDAQSITDVVSKGQNDTLETEENDTLNKRLTLLELQLLKAISDEPAATQNHLAVLLGVSERTVKRHMQKLQARGLISRRGGKRFGEWVVLGEGV